MLPAIAAVVLSTARRQHKAARASFVRWNLNRKRDYNRDIVIIRFALSAPHWREVARRDAKSGWNRNAIPQWAHVPHTTVTPWRAEYIPRRAVQHRHRSFVSSPFVILYIFITALHHRRVPMCILSRARCLFFLPPLPPIYTGFSSLSVSTSTDINQWLSSINVRRWCVLRADLSGPEEWSCINSAAVASQLKCD